MEYLTADFKITCPNGMLQTARDLLADSAAEAGFESFEDTASGIRGYVQTSLLDKEALDNAISSFPLLDTTISYTISKAENRDWNETWEEAGFEPIDIDGKIVIVDGNHAGSYNVQAASNNSQSYNPIVIKIGARLAFGTGTHETTQMIVSTLLTMDIQDKRLLDCGCGTGILGIAASKLGAKNVVSYDIDEWSVENTRHNAELNGIENIKAILGDASVIATLDGKFDIVLANINRNILLHDMQAMASVLADGGALILSGFYESDVPSLEAKAYSLGLNLNDKKAKGGWRMLKFGK